MYLTTGTEHLVGYQQHIVNSMVILNDLSFDLSTGSVELEAINLVRQLLAKKSDAIEGIITEKENASM